MRTDQLISLLATGAGPVEPHAIYRRIFSALFMGFIGSVVLMIFTVGLLPEFTRAITAPKLVTKLAFTSSMVVISLVLVAQLASPGKSFRTFLYILGVPIICMWALGITNLLSVESSHRLGLVLGDTWSVCSALIAMLSLPMFIALLAAMRDLAPTRLTLSGAVSGLCAGATGALVYSLHCPEVEAPFIGVWYVLGMLIPSVIGAALGRTLLRW